MCASALGQLIPGASAVCLTGGLAERRQRGLRGGTGRRGRGRHGGERGGKSAVEIRPAGFLAVGISTPSTFSVCEGVCLSFRRPITDVSATTVRVRMGISDI